MNEIQTTQAERLRQLHSEIIVTLNITLDKAIESGGILRDVKGSLPHGEFGEWVESNTGFNIRTAQRYMKVFDNRNLLKSDSVSYLHEAYKLLSAPKQSDDIFSIPAGGCGLIYYNDDDDQFVIVVPHEQDGYVFRTWVEGDFLIGDTRGVSTSHIKTGCPLASGSWKKIMVQPGRLWSGPWKYNLLLFDENKKYQEAIRLEVIESKDSIDKLTWQLKELRAMIQAELGA